MNAMEEDKFILPGGSASRRRGESRIQAAVRELREEMDKHAYSVVELFQYTPHPKYNILDYHMVFYVRAAGVPEPRREVMHIGCCRPGLTEIGGGYAVTTGGK